MTVGFTGHCVTVGLHDVTVLTPRIWRWLVDGREVRGNLVKVSVS